MSRENIHSKDEGTIAAQALVHRSTLVTFNQDDFSDVPGLSSLGWRSLVWRLK